MASSVHIDNKEKDILILGERPTQGLDDTTLTAESKYSINFTQSRKRFVLGLHYNESNSFLFANAAKIYQLIAKDSEIKKYPLCLRNLSGNCSANDTKKTGLNECVYDFSFDYRAFDTSNIIDIHNYLMKKHDIK